MRKDGRSCSTLTVGVADCYPRLHGDCPRVEVTPPDYVTTPGVVKVSGRAGECDSLAGAAVSSRTATQGQACLSVQTTLAACLWRSCRSRWSGRSPPAES